MIYYCTDPQQHEINLFYMIKKQNLVKGDVIYPSIDQRTNQNACIIQLKYKLKSVIVYALDQQEMQKFKKFFNF